MGRGALSPTGVLDPVPPSFPWTVRDLRFLTDGRGRLPVSPPLYGTERRVRDADLEVETALRSLTWFDITTDTPFQRYLSPWTSLGYY